MHWYRVDADVVDHPKVFALAEALKDPNAGWYVVRLWSWTAKYAARGRLADGARTALETACGWRGQSGALLSALISTGWLEETANGLEVHDWWEKQGQAVEKAERDAQRKRERRAVGAETARAGRADGAGTRRDETRRDVKKEEGPEAAPLPLALVPPPVPAPQVPVDPKALEDKLTDEEFHVFEHWRVALHKPKARATADRKKRLRESLKVWTVAELQLAIDGCAASEWHRREGQTDLELILRDAKHIEAFMAKAPGAAHA